MTEELNRRHNLATIPTINNNGESYIVPFDIYKEGYEAYDISNWFKGRVGDNGTPFGIRWYKHGQLMDVTGMRPFIEGQVGDYTIDDSDPDDPKINMDSEASNVHVVGEVNDCQEYGVAIYRLINQAMPQSGIFYGKIGVMGTQDDGTTVMSSVDVVFKVLAGHMNMIGARKFYVSELEKALVEFQAKIKKHDQDYATLVKQHDQEFQEQTRKVIDDARNTYETETKNAHDSLDALQSQIQANRDEQQNLTSHLVGMDEQIKIHDIITRPEYEQQNGRIDKRLAEMKLNVETYPNLDAVTKAYPNGNAGLIITEDGYRAVWDGTTWAKGSPFVAAGLGDKAVAPTNVSNISFKQVSDNALNLNSIKPWIGVGPTYTVNEDHTIDLTADGSDNGLLFTADSSSLNDDFYINLDVKPLSNQNTQTIDIYLMYPDGRLGKELCSQLSNSEFNQSYELLKVDLKEYIIDNTFTLLLATHAKDINKISLNISNGSSLTTLSDVANKVTCPDMLKTSTLNVKKWQKWNWGAPTDNILVNNAEGLFFRQNALGDLGICSEQKINPESDVYVTLTELSNAWFSVYFVKDLSQITFPNAELTSQYPSLTSPNCYKTFVFKIPKSQIEMQGIKNKATVLIVLHGKDSLIQIKDFSISNSPGSSLVTEKTGQLYKQAGMNFSTQIGNVDLLQVPSSSNGVHYICSKFVSDKDNQVVSQIDVVTKSPGTVNFAVGTIDQNQLLVNETVYSYKVSSTGLNSIPVNIPLNSGQTLLMDISNGIAQLYQPTQVADEVLIQDESHLSKVPGYSGMIFYSMDLALPYQFTVQSKPFDERIQKNEQDINSIEEKTKDLTAKVEKIDNRKLVLNDDNGVQYKLMIVDGKLMAAKSIPENVVIIGNSLTSNTGLIGMNASDADHDYYHYVTEYIKSKNPNVKINPRTNVSSWESVDTTPPTADREKVFNDTIKPLLSADTDLVIIQLGDNVNNPVRESTLANDAQDLIKEIKAISPMAKIMWVYGWFGDATAVDLPIQQACDAEKVTGINIADLNTKDNQGTMGSTFTGLDGKTYTVTDPGVAAHPGDKGHKAISDRIISNFDF